MIHKIKALYDNGNGLGKRAIARQLNISRNTVRKYLEMPEDDVSDYLSDTGRTKELDAYRNYLIHLLELYPELSAVKVQRKLLAKHPEVTVSERSIRRYVNELKQTVATRQKRYYEPVMDMTPGVQCQVDPGELREVVIGGVEQTVYFVVFVLSFSRLMYVALSSRPVNTDSFIRMHDAAFRYFGGVPEECVYDQTRLVVLREQYRELEVNPRFYEFASHAGFQLRVCEGYDPESKGKVEAGVKYVKRDALYGETFADWSELECHLADWLDQVANARVHGTTGQVPRQHYETCERAYMAPYFSPSVVRSDGQPLTRKADKTGLISWQANKYSVPMLYQGATVGVKTENEQLYLTDLETGQDIAQHGLCHGKGQVIKNTHHYRNPADRNEELEQAVYELVGPESGQRLCALLKASEPKIYKDQLRGAGAVLKNHTPVSAELMDKLCRRPRLSVRLMKEILEAYQPHPDRLGDVQTPKISSVLLKRYASLVNQENAHDIH